MDNMEGKNISHWSQVQVQPEMLLRPVSTSFSSTGKDIDTPCTNPKCSSMLCLLPTEAPISFIKYPWGSCMPPIWSSRSDSLYWPGQGMSNISLSSTWPNLVQLQTRTTNASKYGPNSSRTEEKLLYRWNPPVMLNPCLWPLSEGQIQNPRWDIDQVQTPCVLFLWTSRLHKP